MCLRFVFLLITRLTAWLRLARREEAWKTAEILLLRHQLAADHAPLTQDVRRVAAMLRGALAIGGCRRTVLYPPGKCRAAWPAVLRWREAPPSPRAAGDRDPLPRRHEPASRCRTLVCGDPQSLDAEVTDN
jgi:hypothetical protein